MQHFDDLTLLEDGDFLIVSEFSTLAVRGAKTDDEALTYRLALLGRDAEGDEARFFLFPVGKNQKAKKHDSSDTD